MKEDLLPLIAKVNEKIRKIADRNLTCFDITNRQGAFLGYIHFRGKIGVSQKELEKHFEVSHPTVVGIIKKLGEKGLIEVFFKKEDGRNKFVRIADRENDLMRNLKKTGKEIKKILLKNISREEADKVAEILKKILE